MKPYIFILVILISLFFVIFYSVNIYDNYDNINTDNTTIVSGYWKVGNKYGDNKYDEWFKNTLNINQKYIFFCDKSTNEYISNFRGNYETTFIDYPLDNFYTNNMQKKNGLIQPMFHQKN